MPVSAVRSFFYVRKKFCLIFLVVFGIQGIQSCKDKDDVLPVNQLSLGSERIKIAVAYYDDTDIITQENDAGEVFYMHELYFLPEGYHYNGQALWSETQSVGLWLYSSTSEGIVPGRYTVDENAANFSTVAVLFHDVYFDPQGINYSNMSHTAYLGTVDIEKDDDIYTVKLDVSVYGKKLKGTYRGTLDSFF